MQYTKSRVLREGEAVRWWLESLRSGRLKTPSDIRIIETREVKVGNSRLTGESVPVTINPDMQPVPDPGLLIDRRSGGEGQRHGDQASG